MALLVNYEGSYLPPQKLWYLVDGVWKEVTNIFENAAQQELAVLDQERIKQDQVVAALQTKSVALMASIDGSDPSIPLVEDPAAIEAILMEVEVLNLQLQVAQTEQVVVTKQLFEQKAQLEYIKLVTQGETALAKIGNVVTNPDDWKVIRIAPQSTLGERLEVVIQSGLDTNDRVFNYGLVYYRLFKVNSVDANDNLDLLKAEFQRRLDIDGYTLGVEPTNYILTIDTIQNVYTEVNQFVNSGAKRIEDYLASIKDQQKFILDQIEESKASMVQLEEIKIANPEAVPVNENGTIITSATNNDLKVPLGDKLLSYQNVTSFDQLVSTSTLQDIAAGTKDIADYPGVLQLNKDASALNEKLQSVQAFQEVNNQIQNDLISGNSVFNLTVLNTKKAGLTGSKTLFWTSQLGNSTVSSSGGSLSYSQTYTSSGTYKFKNNELVVLSTKYTAIINGLLSSTSTVTLGVTFYDGEQPKIISVKNGSIYAYDGSSKIASKAIQTSIVSANKAHTSNDKTSTYTKFNTVEQPHHNIVFVKENASVTTPSDVTLSVYQPVINGLFYANTEDSGLALATTFSTPIYEYSLRITQLVNMMNVPANGQESFSFNAKEIPLTDYFKNNDNIISQITEEITPGLLSFNAKEIPLTDYFKNNDNIISQITGEITPGLLSFNASHIIMTDFMVKNDNIIQQDKDSLSTPIDAFSFNIKQTNSYLTVKNGYGQDTGYTVGSSINGMVIIKPTSSVNDPFQELKSLVQTSANLRENDGTYKSLDFYQKTRYVISTQTGLIICNPPFEGEILNKLVDAMPRMVTSSSVRVFDTDSLRMDLINAQILDVPRIITSTAAKTMEDVYTNTPYTLDKLNSNESGVTQIITQISTVPMEPDRFELLNKDTSSIPSPAIQLNPGVTLS